MNIEHFITLYFTCTATASDGDGDTDIDSVDATISNTNPTVDTITITPSTNVYSNTSLTCAATASDINDGCTGDIGLAEPGERLERRR